MTDVIYPAIVYTRASWAESWTERDDLRPLSIILRTAGDGGSAAELLGWYGFGKDPDETALSVKSAVSLPYGTWVRIDLWNGSAYAEAFHGICVGQSRELFAADRSGGFQVFDIAGPLELLRTRSIGRSRWWNATTSTTITVDWVPPINDRDNRGMALGNRTSAKHPNPDLATSTSYLYGEDESWTFLEYVEYLLAQFCDTAGGPTWSLGGQSSLLANLLEPVDWEATQTAADMIERLISRDYGLDYTITTTETGFSLNVFSLLADDVAFGGVTLTGNPNHVSLEAGVTYQNVQNFVGESTEEQYGRLRVLGGRLVVCCSLWGQTVLPAGVLNATLLPGWDAADETDYRTATGAHVAQYRANERFGAVFRTYEASPYLYSYNEETNPTANDDGTIDAETGSPFQWVTRETLDWLPLRTDTKYGATEAEDVQFVLYGGKEPELQKPVCWGKYKQTVQGPFDALVYDSWLRLDDVGIDLAALPHRLGIHLDATPNHLIGPPEGTALNDARRSPIVRYDEMVATIAFRTDARLHLQYDVPDGDTSIVKEIFVDDCECWWLAPYTAVGMEHVSDDLGDLVVTTEGRELRNEADRLALVMAGAIARYGNPRARAVIQLLGACPAGTLLGKILDELVDGVAIYTVKAPITEVSIQFGRGDGVPSTSIATGYAEITSGVPQPQEFRYEGKRTISDAEPKIIGTPSKRPPPGLV